MAHERKGEGQPAKAPERFKIHIFVTREHTELLKRFKREGISASAVVREGLDLLKEKPMEKAIDELFEKARRLIPKKVGE